MYLTKPVPCAILEVVKLLRKKPRLVLFILLFQNLNRKERTEMRYPKGCGEIEADNELNVVVSLEETYLIPTLIKVVGKLASVYWKGIKEKAGELDDEERKKIKKELMDTMEMFDDFCNLYGWLLIDL